MNWVTIYGIFDFSFATKNWKECVDSCNAPKDGIWIKDFDKSGNSICYIYTHAVDSKPSASHIYDLRKAARKIWQSEEQSKIDEGAIKATVIESNPHYLKISVDGAESSLFCSQTYKYLDGSMVAVTKDTNANPDNDAYTGEDMVVFHTYSLYKRDDECNFTMMVNRKGESIKGQYRDAEYKLWKTSLSRLIINGGVAYDLSTKVAAEKPTAIRKCPIEKYGIQVLVGDRWMYLCNNYLTSSWQGEDSKDFFSTEGMVKQLSKRLNIPLECSKND